MSASDPRDSVCPVCGESFIVIIYNGPGVWAHQGCWAVLMAGENEPPT